MVDMSGLVNKDGVTTEEKLQNELAGDDIQLTFKMEGSDDIVYQAVFKQGVTFEWVKNKVAEKLEANYNDLTLHLNDRRIPEPFCLIDMGITTGTTIFVKLAEGAVLGHEALREQVLAELAREQAEEEQKG